MTKIAYVFGLTFIAFGCFKSEVFPTTPHIEFENIRFIDGDGIDSLILGFRFEDGDGDIGLTSEEIVPPYHNYSIIMDAAGYVVGISTKEHVAPYYEVPIAKVTLQNVEGYALFFRDSSFIGNTIDLPPYDCEFYEIIEEDTLLVIRNTFYYNLYVEFLKKSIQENHYQVINFREVFNSNDCTLGNFNSRIPLFDQDGKEGVINYAMLSLAFRLTFQDDSIKLRFFIYDRSFNKSNTVETSAFVFSDLR